ncbi:asparaginase [Aeromicrobium sp.]|uniref:asparaginase n=1 Tax=Aeromicrobium sp. TaxID=1871063 RepID=UPI003D6AE3B7
MDVLVEVVRSGFVESRHRGVAVRVDADGEVMWSTGVPDTVIFPRSANKPFQALGMMAAGLPLNGPELALAAASHSGEPFHLDAVRDILARSGLDESALQTPPSYPLDPKEHAAVLRAGGGRAPILMDCSGKHAAMLLTSVVNDWPTDSYLEPDHPLQQTITETFARLTGAAPEAVGVDGCGAPLLATTLRRLAMAIARVVVAPDGSDERRLVDAMLAHPEYVSGTRRDDLRLMRAIPGLVAKSGAESVLVAGLPDGSGCAVKIEDGGWRPLFVAMHRVLEIAGLDAALLHERPAVLGGGKQVGEVRPAF